MSTSPRRRFGIRARVVASFLVLLVTAEVVSIAVFHQVGANRIDQQVTEDLATVTDDLRVRLENEQGALGREGGETLRSIFDQFLQARPARGDQAYLAIVGGEPFAASSGAPVALEQLPVASTWATLRATDAGEVATPEGPLRWLAVPVLAGGDLLGVFVATELLTSQQATLQDTIVLVGAVTVLVLVAACLLAWGAAGRALAPLRGLATTTRSVAGGDDLGARVAVDGHDEVADLATSVNGMLDRLQRSFDSQKDFLDDAGHELRAPLTIVRGHLELLDDDPRVRAEEVALIVDEIDRMERLVADLRLLARSERPDFLTTDTVDVASFLVDLGRKAEMIAPRTWTIEPAASGTVRADRQRLTQAVLNLAENAANVTHDGDPIVLRAAASPTSSTTASAGSDLVLSVRDEGPGIAPDDIATLFDRTGRAVRRRVSGTGLGLPIVAAVARAHGGTVSVTSELGRGTTFELTVPGLVPAADPARVERDAPEADRRTRDPLAAEPTVATNEVAP